MILIDENGKEHEYQEWVTNLILDLSFNVNAYSTADLAKKYNRSLSTIYKYKEDPVIIEVINRNKAEYIAKYKEKLLTMVEKSMDALGNILEKGEDAPRLRAAEAVLKAHDILSENKNISVSIPKIEIVGYEVEKEGE